MADLEIVAPVSPEAWEKWLEKHHTTSPGVWLRMFKKDSGKLNLTYSQAVMINLCFGWIDSVRHKGDHESFLQRCTPRKKGGMWSKLNTEFVEKMTKEGKMRPAGMKEVEDAKRDGRWDRAYERQGWSKTPPDFLKELKKTPKAFAFYETLNKVNKYAIYFRLQSAKKPETREKRLKKFLQMMREGKKFH